MSNDLRQLIQILYIIPVALVSVTLHEYMHGYVSYRLGDPTAKSMGRLTLNPLKHIDIIGLIMMIIAKIGWAKPVPINPDYYKNRKLGTVLTSIAGPLTNLTLAFVMCIPFLLMSNTTFRISSINNQPIQIIYNIISLFVEINISLAIFNLLPLPPLDGYKILSAVLPERLYFKIMSYERYLGMVLLALFVFDGWINKGGPGILSPIIRTAVNFIYYGMRAIIMPLLNAFT